jgi:hypothetical protein
MDITTSTNVDEINIVNPINPTLSDVDKLKALEKLTQENIDFVRAFLEQIDTKFGTKSKYSIKEPKQIINKVSRPSIIRNRPWFKIEHIRDTFRFQSVVSNLDVVSKIAQELKTIGIEIIEIDSKTILKPTRLGWRMIVIDLRLKNGQIVEYQMLIEELDAVSDEGHKIFEKWRDKDLSQLNQEQKREQFKDRRESKNSYDRAWKAYLQRTAQTENQVATIMMELYNVLQDN